MVWLVRLHKLEAGYGIERRRTDFECEAVKQERCRERQNACGAVLFFDYLLLDSMGVLEPLPAAETRLGPRTALTFALLPPPQKN